MDIDEIRGQVAEEQQDRRETRFQEILDAKVKDLVAEAMDDLRFKALEEVNEEFEPEFNQRVRDLLAEASR